MLGIGEPISPQGIPIATDRSIFRGQSSTLLKRDEYEALVPVFDVKVRILDLSNPEDLTEYQHILDMNSKNYYVIGYEEKEWVPEKQTWFILIKYGIKFLEPPGSLERRVKFDGNKVTIKGPN